MQTSPDTSPANDTVAAITPDVQSASAAVLALVDDPAQQTLAQFERALWSALMTLGRALVMAFLARRTAQAHRAAYEHDGVCWRVGRTHGSLLATRFGRLTWTRPTGQSEGREMDLPIDRALGIAGSPSFGTIVLMAYLCARVAFTPAREIFAKTHGWKPSQDMTLRIVDAVGPAVKPFLTSLPCPDDEGEILIIQVDARGAPMISPSEAAKRKRPKRKRAPGDGSVREVRRKQRRVVPRVRRAPGQKSKNARGATLVVMYTLRRTADGWEGPVNKRVFGTFGGHEALFQWLLPEAIKRGYGTKRTIFLADGACAIWRRQEKYLPEAEVCLDWCHVEERLWVAGTGLFRQGSAALKAWVAEQTDRLRRGEIAALLDALRCAYEGIAKTGPGNKGRRERLEKNWAYLTRHAARLRYAALLAENLDIGTGAVEGAVRNIVELRLDGPGMRWGRERAELVLHLRCVLASDLWDDFERHLEDHAAPRLAAHPVAATPYQAKPRKAA